MSSQTPNTLTVVRHGQTPSNQLQDVRSRDPAYLEFQRAYDRQPRDYAELHELALGLIASGKFSLGYSDPEMPLTSHGRAQALLTGAAFSRRAKLPDGVILSPHKRAVQTLEQMTVAWPGLSKVPTIEDTNANERDHGSEHPYHDWRIFSILHPEERKLLEEVGFYWYPYLKGESIPQVRERQQQILDRMSGEYPGANVLLITGHVASIALRATIEQLNPDGFMNLYQKTRPINCGVTTYANSGTGAEPTLEVVTYNQRLS